MFNKRVFVSGGAGVIGTALVDLLLKEGADVFVGDLKPCPKHWLGKVKYRQGDLNHIPPDDLLAFDPEIFFHLAATFERSEESYPFFGENYHHNVRLSHTLLDILKEADSLVKVVFASSYLIYDPSLYLFAQPHDQPITLNEEFSIYPRNICGGAKLFHELELRFLSQFLGEKSSFILARIFRVYGYRSRDIISRWVRAALRHEPVKVYCPEGRFDYIFADDVAEALVRLSQTAHSGIVNVGSGQSQSIQSVLKLIQGHFPDLKIEKMDSDIPYESSQADIGKLRQWTGWEPPHCLEMALPKLIQFERELLDSAVILPQRPSVLVTSISKKMPLLEAVRQAAAKIAECEYLYGSDSDPSCIGKYGVDEFWHCPSLKDLSLDALMTYCHEHSITSIIPTRDGELEFFASHAKSLAAEGIRVMVSDLTVIQTCLDKKRFADELAKHHFPSIATALSLAQIDAPLYVVKERCGAGSHKMGLKLTKEEAERHAINLEEPLFQPFIEGREWSVDLYRSREGRVQGCVARMRDLVVNGESQVTTTASYPALETLCEQMSDHLKIYGHAIFQVIEDKEGQFHVIECNPRFGGASTASLAMGLDSFVWFFAECLGLSLKDYPFIRRKGEVRQIRYMTDRILPWSSYSI